jgi:hypothetical protein
MFGWFFGSLWLAVAVIVLLPVWLNWRRIGWQVGTYLTVTALLAGLAGMLWVANRDQTHFLNIPYVVGMLGLSLAGIAAFFGLLEFGILRGIGGTQLGAMARVTYYEGLLQPFTLIVLGSGMAVIGVCARLGFFTYYEDFKMYRDVAASFVFLFAMPVMVFASTKVIDEEIENRTMLTLMSKPVSRTQVVLGKYLGVALLALAAVGVLGMWGMMCSYLRYFDDMVIDYRVAGSAAEITRLNFENTKAMLAIVPALALTFMQVAALAAVSVAISTRFGLAVNITVVVLIYITANLASFLINSQDVSGPWQAAVGMFAYLLPGLTQLDLNQRLIFGNYSLGANDWAPNTPTYGAIWRYVALSGTYTVLYVGAVLSFGVAMFRNRELT